ncbi:RDD family protein [Candidatus Enterococcus murrayae]|uniref:RDD family protein n=1 Tax=Candidatus Enterococcus murrayae TaxID=2815321 RepID=A0ABS3HPI9_9ENTE|nr:RDD family protein [Enterococcus sp. MJM16]MBO0454952.1 RDD family protein [Enterococcus sp. MJM16]
MTDEASQRPAVGPVAQLLEKKHERQFHHYPDYFYAGFWIRSFAYLLDLLCISAITKIVLGVPTNLLGLTKSSELFSIYGFSTLLIYLAYFILMTKINHGQTIGKMVFGIRVVCYTEEELSWQTVLVREGACRFVLRGSLFMLGYLVTIFTPNKQHIGDYFSDTSVVTLNLLAAREGVQKNDSN